MTEKYIYDIAEGLLPVLDEIEEIYPGQPSLFVRQTHAVTRADQALACLLYPVAQHTVAGLPRIESGDTWTHTTLSIRLEDRWLVNPGSVGQPRDGDPRAAYAVVDLDARTVTLHRVQYDVAAEQASIRAAGLPDLLASRLAEGR